MKKTLLLLAMLATTAAASAQLMRAEELEAYSEKLYGSKWVDVAANLVRDQSMTLDKNKALTIIQVVEAPGRTKTQLYATLNYWFTATFNDANSVIKLNDKELGCIIAQGSVENIATHSGGMNKYNISIRPIIRVDIKEGRCRISYSLQAYNVFKSEGGGIIGQIGAALSSDGTNTTVDKNETWPIDRTYPFAENDAYKAKRTSSKAAVMSYCYSQVMLDKIETAIKEGMVGEDNDW